MNRHDLHTFSLSELRDMLPQAGHGNPYPREWIVEEIRVRESRKDYRPPNGNGIVAAVVNLRSIMLQPRRPKRHC